MIEFVVIHIEAKFIIHRDGMDDETLLAEADLIGIGKESSLPLHQQDDALQCVCLTLQTMWEANWDPSCDRMTAEYQSLRSVFTVTADEQSLHEDVWVNGAADLLQEV
jgi:hypothetical protein